jgi:hypothetical protein
MATLPTVSFEDVITTDSQLLFVGCLLVLIHGEGKTERYVVVI